MGKLIVDKYHMNNYCINLDFGIPLLKLGIDVRDLPTKYGNLIAPQTAIDIAKVINPDLIKLLELCGLFIIYSEIFYTAPNTFTPIHTDELVPNTDLTKLNWAFGGKDSIMNWYSVDNSIVRQGIKTTIGNPYVEFALNECRLIHSEHVGTPSLVQVGTPHNITNYDEPRYCICAVCHHRNNTKSRRPSTAATKAALAKYILT
jgi:hypothetical protein